MKQMLCALALISAAITLMACSGSAGRTKFSQSFAAVSTGASKDQVRSTLGEPDARLRHTVRSGVNRAESATLAKTLAAGAPYEDWVYRRGQTDYHLYFGSGSGAPVEAWRLINRRSVAHGEP